MNWSSNLFFGCYIPVSADELQNPRFEGSNPEFLMVKSSFFGNPIVKAVKAPQILEILRKFWGAENPPRILPCQHAFHTESLCIRWTMPTANVFRFDQDDQDVDWGHFEVILRSFWGHFEVISPHVFGDNHSTTGSIYNSYDSYLLRQPRLVWWVVTWRK